VRLGVYDREGHPVPQPRIFSDVREVYRRISECVKAFERSVWFGGLQDFIVKKAVSGHEARYKDLRVMSYYMCGAARFQIELPDGSRVTLQTLENEKSGMGLFGIDATETQAIDMLSRVTAAWEFGKLKFKADQTIHV